MTVLLINLQRRKQTFTLDTQYFQKDAVRMTVVVTEERGSDGARFPRRVRRSLPTSLTLLAGERRGGLPDQILGVPSIKKAVAAKKLRAVRAKEEAAATTKAAKAEKPTKKKTKGADK